MNKIEHKTIQNVRFSYMYSDTPSNENLLFSRERTIGKKPKSSFLYVKTNHLGNVHVVITDIKKAVQSTTNPTILAYYEADVVSAVDYYCGGSIMPGRNFSANAYRFGWNTQEKVDEISGVGNHYTAEFWEYDSRTLRRWNRDNKPVAYESEYAVNRNNSINNNDPNGDCPDCPTETGTSSDKKESKWTNNFEPNVTNLDYVTSTSSGNYKFNGQSAGVDGHFNAYSSAQNALTFGPIGNGSESNPDQAGHWLVTSKNKNSGFTITYGVIHDKREQTLPGTGNNFRYSGGGTAPTLMFGKQLDFDLGSSSKIGLQAKAGGFVNIVNISADLNNGTTTFSSTSNSRRFAGGGFVATASVSYSYVVNKAWSVSLSVNGTFMAGQASTTVNAMNNSTGGVSSGTLSVGYSSLSVGPAIGVTFGGR